MNIVIIRGCLSSAPVDRQLASGSVLRTLEVTTVLADGSSASVPVAWFDPPNVPPLEAGTAVVVSGVVRRRFFRVGAVTQSRTEVVAAEVVRAGDRRRVRRLFDRVGDTLGGDGALALPSR